MESCFLLPSSYTEEQYERCLLRFVSKAQWILGYVGPRANAAFKRCSPWIEIQVLGLQICGKCTLPRNWNCSCKIAQIVLKGWWFNLKMHMFHATLTIVLRGTSTFKCDVIRSSRVEPFVKWRLCSSTRIAKAYIRAYMQQNHILLHIHRRLEYFHGIIKTPLCLGWWLPFSLNMCPAQWGLNLPTCPHTNPPSLITKLCN